MTNPWDLTELNNEVITLPQVSDPDHLTLICKKHNLFMDFYLWQRDKLPLYRCPECGLIQLKENLPGKVSDRIQIIKDKKYENFINKIKGD